MFSSKATANRAAFWHSLVRDMDREARQEWLEDVMKEHDWVKLYLNPKEPSEVLAELKGNPFTRTVRVCFDRKEEEIAL